MTIVNTLVISTQHVSDETIEWLDVAPLDIGNGVTKYDFGWIIFVVEEYGDFPCDLRGIIDYAHEKDCMYIFLDIDADVCDDLPMMKTETYGVH